MKLKLTNHDPLLDRTGLRTDVLPICDVCNKGVDRVTCEVDRCTYERIYIVYCHGEKEVTRISEEILATGDIQFGRAFTQKKLTE